MTEEHQPKNNTNEPITASTLWLNSILRGLSKASAEQVIRKSELISLSLREQIYAPESEIRDVYFPLTCVLSVVTTMKDGGQIEIGTIGREGMSAFPLLLGATKTVNDSYCQVPGKALRLSVPLYRELFEHSVRFKQLLDRYLQAYVNMLGQLAACNRLHNVEERCARWLLMTFDRVDADSIPLTHEFLGMMLGAGRSGVTIAAATLQRAGFITYSHGTIKIVDRAGLEDASCECYEVARRQFARLL